MNRVVQIRQSHGLSVDQLAARANISELELTWIERDGVPRLADAIQLMRFFNCECDELFPETERHRETFQGIVNGTVSLKRFWELDLPEFDVDPRFWFLCVRLCGQWQRIYVRSRSVQKIRSVLAVDVDSFLAIESCGYHLVLNCHHISAFELVARKDTNWIKNDPLGERDLSVLFADGGNRKFRFQSPEPIANGLDRLEFVAPSVEPCLEFDDRERFFGLATSAVAMLRTSMSNLRE